MAKYSQLPVMDKGKHDEQSMPLTRGTDDETDSVFDSGSSSGDGPQFSGSRFNGRRIPQGRDLYRNYLCTAARYALCAAVFTFVGAQIAWHNLDLDHRCAAYTTQYSPVLKEVDIKYSLRHFNGSFLKEDIYRKPGSPEVDAAWEALGADYRPGIISQSEGLASGLGPGHVQVEEKYGGGFIVNVEGLHHLHCLNFLRKALYFNYEYYKNLGAVEFTNSEPIVHLHVTHCLDTIRQVLMCNADTGVLGQVWWAPGGHHHHGGNSTSTGSSTSHAAAGDDHNRDDKGHAHGERSTNTPRRHRSMIKGRIRRHGDDDDDEDESSSSSNSNKNHEDQQQQQQHDQHAGGETNDSSHRSAETFPDFWTVHKCKNFDAIRAYAESIQTPPNENLPKDYLVRPDPKYIISGTP